VAIAPTALAPRTSQRPDLVLPLARNDARPRCHTSSAMRAGLGSQPLGPSDGSGSRRRHAVGRRLPSYYSGRLPLMATSWRPSRAAPRRRRAAIGLQRPAGDGVSAPSASACLARINLAHLVAEPRAREIVAPEIEIDAGPARPVELRMSVRVSASGARGGMGMP
jgi:hypothetical protein